MSGAKASNASKGQNIRSLVAKQVSRRHDRLPLRGTFRSAQFVRVHRLTPRIVMRTDDHKADLPLSLLRRIISLIAPRSEARNLRKIGEYTRRGNVASCDIYFHVKALATKAAPSAIAHAHNDTGSGSIWSDSSRNSLSNLADASFATLGHALISHGTKQEIEAWIDLAREKLLSHRGDGDSGSGDAANAPNLTMGTHAETLRCLIDLEEEIHLARNRASPDSFGVGVGEVPIPSQEEARASSARPARADVIAKLDLWRLKASIPDARGEGLASSAQVALLHADPQMNW
uniref:hypothetical protein n=1 Tax=Pandoraea pnomenusa TaxID=93220 RepID=UPI0003C73AFC|nr:hypothetical protein [Pandoraea pnomenusa]